MIVADKIKSLNKADEIAKKLLLLISEETKSFQVEDDPAESAYLAVHVMGNLISRLCQVLEGYGHIYGINNMTTDCIRGWMNLVADEYLKAYKEAKIGLH